MNHSVAQNERGSNAQPIPAVGVGGAVVDGVGVGVAVAVAVRVRVRVAGAMTGPNDVGTIPDSPAQRRLWDEIKATTRPSTATVLSDASGRWFHAYCVRCGWRGQAAKDKALIQSRADKHNVEKHA